jgi:hypothetical protein
MSTACGMALIAHYQNYQVMKRILLIPLLLFALNGGAQTQMIESGHLTTAPGIGGDAETGYAFTKGDVITVSAKSSKQLDRMLVLMYPDEEIGRYRATKTPSYTFTVPHDGIVIIRFVSDRGHTNQVDYTVTRMPASPAVANYNTKVIWEKPADGLHHRLVPKRAVDVANR